MGRFSLEAAALILSFSSLDMDTPSISESDALS